MFGVTLPIKNVCLFVCARHFLQKFEKSGGDWTPHVWMNCQYTSTWATEDFQFKRL